MATGFVAGIQAPSISLRIVGPAVGKGRPRVLKTGRTYTPKPTVLAEEAIRTAWREAGEVRLPDDAAVSLVVQLCIERPAGHFKRDGSLSAEGQRHPIPRRKPDLDNAAKLVMDALNGFAYRDDAQVASLVVHRFWGSKAGTYVFLMPLYERWGSG